MSVPASSLSLALGRHAWAAAIRSAICCCPLAAAPAMAGLPTGAPAGSPCTTVDRIELLAPAELPDAVRDRGASALPQDPFAFVQRWLDEHRPVCIDKEQLEMLTRGASRAVLDQGYVTSRVLVPEQDLGTGVLRLALIPGVIGQLRFADPKARGSWKTAFPTESGALLRLADLEQGLEQMKHAASQEVDMQVVPTDKPGVSDVVIAVTRSKRWTATASLDDSGSRSTGKRQGNVSVSLDNPLWINDVLTVGYGRDVLSGSKAGDHGGGNVGWNGVYSLPCGYWTATVSASGSHYSQRVAGVNQTFAFHGESHVLDLKLHRVIHRSQTDVMGLQWRLSRRFGKSYIEDVEIAQQRRNNTVAEVAVTDRHFLGTAQLDASLAYRQGVGGLGAQADTLAAMDGPAWQFRMAVGDAVLTMPLTLRSLPLRFTSTVRGQFTNHRLYFVDALAIGSRHTVRGFDGEAMLAGESGFYWRNELQMPIPVASHSFYAGLDYGKVYGPTAAALPGNALAGAVVGLRGGVGNRSGVQGGGRFGSASYDLFIGVPVHKPMSMHTAAVTGGFQLAYQY